MFGNQSIVEHNQARYAAGSRKRVALYLRVSTTGQNTTNQRRELEAVAKRHGWEVVQVFSDNGISGAVMRIKAELAA